MIRFYYHCLGLKPADERFLASALEKLAQYLRREPTKLDITLIPLKNEPELGKKVNEALGQLRGNDPNAFADYAGRIRYLLATCGRRIAGERFIPRLIMYCPKESPLAQAAINSTPLALWGISNPFNFAAVYEPNNECIIWHEALHTLGADDCYEEKPPHPPKPDCTLGPSCVMQYEHTNPKKTLAPWPFLCEKNIRLLQEFRDKVSP